MHALGADTGAVTGPATILHQPETANHKRHPAHPVRLEQHTGERHAAAAIAGELPDPPRPTAAARSRSAGPRRARSNDPLLALAPAVYVRALTGLTPGRAGKLSCPFHADEHPSLHVYPTPERGWMCFSCGRDGSIYDLAAALWDRPTRRPELRRLRLDLQDELGITAS